MEAKKLIKSGSRTDHMVILRWIDRSGSINSGINLSGNTKLLEACTLAQYFL